MLDKEKLQMAVTLMLEAFGEDLEREGIKDTPKRVAKMYEEVLSGYYGDEKEILSRVFTSDNADIVLVKDIDFYSMCEHHLMPFFGKAHIAYIPNGKVLGLSKFGRIVDLFAKRLQLQEQLTNQIADSLMRELEALGVFVYIEAEHTCMSMRGIKKVGAKTVTTTSRGQIKSNLELQKQIIDMIKA